MNSETKAISRRDFLKSFSREFIKRVQTVVVNIANLPLDEESQRCENKEKPGTKKAFIDIERCLAWQGADCQLCYLACPLREKAVIMEDLKPLINVSSCDGCAMCEVACRTVNNLAAIKMSEFADLKAV